jgi:hypothetical protein
MLESRAAMMEPVMTVPAMIHLCGAAAMLVYSVRSV